MELNETMKQNFRIPEIPWETILWLKNTECASAQVGQTGLYLCVELPFK
jgi:hypothetical protein